MRILHLDFGREMRGGQWQVLRLMRGLRELSRSADQIDQVLGARPNSPLWLRAVADGFSVQRAGFFRLPQADLVHAHEARSHSLAAIRSAIGSAAPLVVSRRVAFPPRVGWLSRWKYRKATHFIAVSKFVADILISSGVSSNKVTVVHDGVALLPLTDWKDRLDPHDAVVAAASADPLKMGELARQAVQAAGMRLIESEDLEVDLTRARQFLYLTCAEGLGSAILMAMSAGVAVVASRVGGIPEIIRDGENGLLVENHFESVAAALVRLKRDSAFANQLGANGRSTVETRFTEGQMAAATLELYKRVLRD